MGVNKQELIKPYGDTLNDGIVQLSFTLPVEYGDKAKKAAEIYVGKLNFRNINVAHASKISDNFTYFVVYASAQPTLDYSSVVTKALKIKQMDFYEINSLIKKSLGRKLVVVGAAIGSDAHTVGIDAIMNMKGYNQDYGLERYPQIKAINLGAQVAYESLIERAVENKADAVLVSQAVTQKKIHIQNLSGLMGLIKKKGLRRKFILIAGGPGISNDLAIKLGYDAGFGRDTRPSQVATFIITKLMKNHRAA